MGIIIRDHNGDVIATVTGPVQPLHPVQAIEALAIIQGFSLAQQIGI